MLNETLASLYEDMKNYTRGTEISTPLLVLGEVFLRYAIDNRIGLVLDRNFDLYIQMARNLENPYHLYEKSELEEFISAIDESLEKDGYKSVSDILPTLSFMYDEEDNKRFQTILSTKSFRKTYADFLSEDFRNRENMSSLLYTLSYQSRKDWREERSYSLGLLIAGMLNLNKLSLVKEDLKKAELLLSAIALESDARTITDKDNIYSRLLSPLSRRIGKIEENEKNTVLITDRIPEKLDDAFKENEKILLFAPSSLLLSSSRENLEKREELIKSKAIRSVIVLPPLSQTETEITTLILLTGDENETVSFADLNSKSKDREYVVENQITDSSIGMIEELLEDEIETDEITRNVSLEKVEEKMILVPMNYLEKKGTEVTDTEEMENRINTLYEKLAALIGI